METEDSTMPIPKPVSITEREKEIFFEKGLTLGQQQFSALLKSSPFTQGEIAKYVGCSQATVSWWMSGRTKPGLDRLFKIAILLGVHPLELKSMLLTY